LDWQIGFLPLQNLWKGQGLQNHRQRKKRGGELNKRSSIEGENIKKDKIFKAKEKSFELKSASMRR